MSCPLMHALVVSIIRDEVVACNLGSRLKTFHGSPGDHRWPSRNEHTVFTNKSQLAFLSLSACILLLPSPHFHTRLSMPFSHWPLASCCPRMHCVCCSAIRGSSRLRRICSHTYLHALLSSDCVLLSSLISSFLLLRYGTRAAFTAFFDQGFFERPNRLHRLLRPGLRRVRA